MEKGQVIYKYLKIKIVILAAIIQVYVMSKILEMQYNEKYINTFPLTVEYSTLKILILIKIFVLFYAVMKIIFFLIFL